MPQKGRCAAAGRASTCRRCATAAAAAGRQHAVEAVLAGSADMPLQMLLASRRAGHCSPWQAAVSQHHAVPLLPTCHAGLHRLSVVLLCWNDSAVAMPGTLRPPAAASRQDGPKRRSIEQQMGTAGSGERRLKIQGWDGVSSSVQRPHLRAACCGSRSRARCRRRPPTFAAPSAAEPPPPGSPAAKGRYQDQEQKRTQFNTCSTMHQPSTAASRALRQPISRGRPHLALAGGLGEGEAVSQGRRPRAQNAPSAL